MVYEDLCEQQFKVKRSHSIPNVLDRVLAVAFDAVLFAPIFSLLLSQIFKRVQLSRFSNPESLEYFILFSVAVILVAFLTVIGQTLSLYYFAATPGKYFFKLKVLSGVNQNTGLTFQQCFIRSILWSFEFVLLGLPFIEIISHPLRRALHDRASETVVVSLKQVENSTPHPYEVQFVKTFVMMFSLVLFAWGITFVTQIYKSASRGDFKKYDLKDEGYFCEKISSLVDMKNRKTRISDSASSSRIDLAIGLHLVNEIEDHCLLNEAEFGLWTVDPGQKAWGYLAKGIYFNSFDTEKAKKYLAQVCIEQKASEACQISKIYLSENGESLTGESITSLVIKSQVDLSGMAALSSHFKPDDAVKNLDKLASRSEGFDSYIQKQMVKFLWTHGEYEKSQGAFTAIWSTLSSVNKMQMSSWLCLAEVNRECKNKNYPSCDYLKKMITSEKEVVAEVSSIIGLVREHDCKNSQAPLLPQLSSVLSENEDLNHLVLAISKESNWSLEHRIFVLQELKKKSKAKDLISTQAQMALAHFQKTTDAFGKTRVPASSQTKAQP